MFQVLLCRPALTTCYHLRALTVRGFDINSGFQERTLVTNMMRELAKWSAAQSARQVWHQARYARMILVLSHMRSASTALCNVLASHDQISGYGETHVCHGQSCAPGRVVVNLIRHRAFDAGAPFIIDKVLHSHLDRFPAEAFQEGRAIFLLRRPVPAIASIIRLSQQTDMPETATLNGAADYYEMRLQRLAELWQRFPPERRIGLTTEGLLGKPDETLACLGQWLSLSPPLRNHYVSTPASRRAGGGDPTFSGRARGIQIRPANDLYAESSDLPSDQAARCQTAYDGLLALMTAN